MVNTISSERATWIRGFFERSEGLKANGHSATALNTTWPTKRSQVTSATGTLFTVIRYLPVASSAAKQTVASAIRPMASSRWRGSAWGIGGRGVIDTACA